jgi:hypothetical protein
LSDLNATTKSEPAATAVQYVFDAAPVGVGACAGAVLVLLLLVAVVYPSWPLVFAPHVQREPSEAMAAAKFEPAATAVQVVPAVGPDDALVGVLLNVVAVVYPSWPSVLSPQAHKAPLESIARAKSDPAATEVKVVPVAIWVGVLLLAVVPLPSWPLVFAPHVQRAPPDSRAMVKFNPAVLDPAAIGDAHAGFRPPRIVKARSAASEAYGFQCMTTPCEIGTAFSICRRPILYGYTPGVESEELPSPAYLS